MSETSDYSPGQWSGHDYSSARSSYQATASRSYADTSAGKTVDDMRKLLCPKEISTNSSCPLIIFCDVTGSMGEWPATIFGKLPYLDHELRTEYLGDDAEVSFGAISEVRCDAYPVQFTPFCIGVDMKEKLASLKLGGGGGFEASYQLGLLYATQNIKTPGAAQKPIMIFIGDEQANLQTLAAAVRPFNIDISKTMSPKDIVDMAMERFNIYFIHADFDANHEKRVYTFWRDLLGESRIAKLADPGRVVDVIFGILAKESGKMAYFRQELEDRQTDAQVDTVYKALETVHALPTKGTTSKVLSAGKSTMHKPVGGTKTKGLL